MPRTRRLPAGRSASARLLLLAAAALACGSEPPPAPEEASVAPAETEATARITDGPHDVAVVDLGALGTLRIELLPELAPMTVEHFIALAESGAYDGTNFHRVIPGFMIQGGDPLSRNLDPRDDGRGDPGDPIPDELSDYPHLRGTVSMANKGKPHSATGQFFIVQEDTRQLDGRYTVFGRVVEGIETVDAVTDLEIDQYGRYGPPNRPYPVDATIEQVRIERVGATAGAAADRAADTADARATGGSPAPAPTDGAHGDAAASGAG